MFVCLCTGVTSHDVNEVVANGATTSKQIADACGAGGEFLTEQLADPVHAEADEIEVFGEQPVVAEPGRQP